MTMWVRLPVRPKDGSPVNDTEGNKIGSVLRSRKGPEDLWEAEIEIEDEHFIQIFQRSFPQYSCMERVR